MPRKAISKFKAPSAEQKKYYKTEKVVQDGQTYIVKYKRSPFDQTNRRPAPFDPAGIPLVKTTKIKKATGTKTTTASKTLSVTSGATKRKLALPESCHTSKTAAKTAATKLRARGIKARVVSSGKFQCVYTVGKCETFKTTAVKKTTRKKTTKK